MRGSFEDQVRVGFSALLRSGCLAIVESSVNAQAFGNAVVTLGGSGLLVRVISDRGDIYGELAVVDAPDAWYPLQYVLSALRGGEPSEGPFSVSGFGDEVCRDWEAIVSAFEPANVEDMRSRIERVREISRARFLARADEISERARRKR